MSERALILVVEDDAALSRLLVDELEADGAQVLAFADLSGARRWLEDKTPALVVTDLRLPDGNGMELVRELTGNEARPAIIVVTAFGSVRQAVEALQAGADDFLTKPLDLDHFHICVERVLETRRLRDEVAQFRRLSGAGDDFHGLFGRSAAMRTLFDHIGVVARAHGPVLINGESGTGKELVARAIHAESERADGPFLAVNCAGVPQELMESEFFGHASGAFTGARAARRGLLQQAHGGTLLLDEIGEMPLALQAKMLRALQDGSIRPVGQDTEEHVDVRVVAATHRDLAQRVADGDFREDLYYRLETFAIDVPPLRARGDDVELLAQRILARCAAAQNKPVRGFAPEALARLAAYPFPGNVRELQNVVERAVAFAAGERVEVVDLPARLANDTMPAPAADIVSRGDGGLLDGTVLPTLDEVQKRYVRRVLDEVGGNRRRAAALLGIGRRTLYRWLDGEREGQ
ncbi:MAG: sigma-54-dependent Fis family transcriptional regulator [Azoarcus sp.]|nr:sigma-54-dependent Fis family transcriptional regulator [Azoarcus sp.]